MSGPGNDERRSVGRTILVHVGTGFELIVPVLLGVFGGHKLDDWLDTEPWFLIGGSLLGMAVGFVNSLLLSERPLGMRAGLGDALEERRSADA